MSSEILKLKKLINKPTSADSLKAKGRKHAGTTDNDEDAGGHRCSHFVDKISLLISIFLAIITFPFSIYFCIKFVKQHERLVHFRNGKVLQGKALGPGLVFTLPCVDRHVKVDLRTVLFDVPPQEILTKDSVSIAVDAVAYFRIFDAKLSVIAIEDAYVSTRMLAATTLRNILGTKTLEQILLDRDEISRVMQVILDEATDPWGVQVERVELKDVRLPIQLQRAMAAEAESVRLAKAKIIAAQGEMDASDQLKMAAEKLDVEPSAIQLRYLQTLRNISSADNQTIVFPLPLHLLNQLNK